MYIYFKTSRLRSTIIFNYEIDKKYQRSNWQRRPLSKGQLEYASIDVYYLEEIYG